MLQWIYFKYFFRPVVFTDFMKKIFWLVQFIGRIPPWLVGVGLAASLLLWLLM
jgi:hypothetical protein